MGLMEFAGGTHSGTRGVKVTEPKNSSSHETGKSLVSVGPGLPAITRQVWDRIKANEYVEFMDLPPARGKAKPLSQELEGQILVVQAADLTQSRKVIPDLPTWL